MLVTYLKLRKIKKIISHFFFFLEEWVHIVSSGTYHPGLQDLNFNFFLRALRVVVTLKNGRLLPSRDVPFTRSNICQETDRFVIVHDRHRLKITVRDS